MTVFTLRQLTAQVRDMHVDGAVKRGEAFAQHFWLKCSRDTTAEMLRQQIQQGELGAG